MSKNTKNSHIGLIIFIIILVLAIAGGAGFYFYQRQQPKKAAEKFLSSMQKMDFNTMESMLQSSDLSALDNADIRNAAYTDFFTAINKKMTYKITGNRFRLQDGTASITAHIKYIDGTSIYKETITEFLRQIVSSAYAGNKLTEEETQKQLATILNERAKESKTDEYSETDITYPVIKTNEGWKIVSLDDETVKIMSANFKSVEDEISQALADSAEATENTTNLAAPDPAASDGTIELSNERFSIHYTRNVVSKDFGGEPCLLVYYDYTNNGESASSAMVDVNLTAFQNGVSLEAAIPESSDDAIDAFMKEVQPGETLNVCQAFSLKDMSPVTLKAVDAFGLDTGITATQTVNLQ